MRKAELTKYTLLLGGILGLFLGGWRAVATMGAPMMVQSKPLLLGPALLLVLSLFTAKPHLEPRPRVHKLLCVLTALPLFAAALDTCINRNPLDRLWILAVIFPALCGFMMILAGSDRRAQLSKMGVVVPVFYEGYLLLQLYRGNATDAEYQHFVPELLCLMAILLALYGAASMRFLPWSRLRGCLYVSLGLFAAGVLLMPCILAREQLATLGGSSLPLWLTQPSLALFSLSNLLWYPREYQDGEEAAEESEA